MKGLTFRVGVSRLDSMSEEPSNYSVLTQDCVTRCFALTSQPSSVVKVQVLNCILNLVIKCVNNWL